MSSNPIYTIVPWDFQKQQFYLKLVLNQNFSQNAQYNFFPQPNFSPPSPQTTMYIDILPGAVNDGTGVYIKNMSPYNCVINKSYTTPSGGVTLNSGGVNSSICLVYWSSPNLTMDSIVIYKSS
jgi:hypothetical protein